MPKWRVTITTEVLFTQNLPFPKLKVCEAIRVRHGARITEQSSLWYITDSIRFHSRKHPRELGLEEVRAYLTDLAVNQNVSASTQNVALSALLFLYKTVLENLPPESVETIRAKRTKTTMIYTHVLNRGGHGVRSPLDT
ncbi:MAG: phage integrase N-terminal SAM-like domain-containing protein [Meiothermus sp.]|nr:phage integrase N-terminal SAM-like domain-containing protein [Meiothermus sp.]